ncbi:unnamed protein product [Prorocentrum cordatum]|uniref:Uncharacterized protein n=1 Tax=Prorocentrum cordatum TaxID=2364126 RepID=A0ABN9QPN2_9DINO|nr:unnamed protein product [Polarella glacialis]
MAHEARRPTDPEASWVQDTPFDAPMRFQSTPFLAARSDDRWQDLQRAGCRCRVPRRCAPCKRREAGAEASPRDPERRGRPGGSAAVGAAVGRGAGSAPATLPFLPLLLLPPPSSSSSSSSPISATGQSLR